MTAQSASACQGFGSLLPCGGTFTVDAPAGVGVGADWSPITFTVADEATDLDVSLGLALSGDLDLTTDDVYVQVKDGATWDDVALTETSGDLTATVPGPGVLAPNATGTVDLRIAVTDYSFDPFDPTDRLDTLTVTGSLLSNAATPTPTVTPPALRGARALVAPAYATASAQIAVSGLDLTTTPSPTHATIGKPFVVDAKLTNNTGSSYHDVLAIPLGIGTGNAPLKAVRPSLRRSGGSAAATLKRVKAAAANTDTVIEFKKNGVWVNLEDTQDVNDADLADLPDGASHTTPWRFTINDPEYVGTGGIAWFAARFAPPGDEQQQTLVPPNANADIVGFAQTDLTVSAAATPKPTHAPTTKPHSSSAPATDTAAANPNGNGDVGTGALAHTGSPLRQWAGISLLLIAAGLVAAFAGRRRGTHV